MVVAESFKIVSVPPNRYADFSLTELCNPC